MKNRSEDWRKVAFDEKGSTGSVASNQDLENKLSPLILFMQVGSCCSSYYCGQYIGMKFGSTFLDRRVQDFFYNPPLFAAVHGCAA